MHTDLVAEVLTSHADPLGAGGEKDNYTLVGERKSRMKYGGDSRKDGRSEKGI